MASSPQKAPMANAEASIEANIAWLREMQEQLRAEHGDLDAYVDRWAEDMFGTPEATAVLVEYVLRDAGELDPEDDDEEQSDDGW